MVTAYNIIFNMFLGAYYDAVNNNDTAKSGEDIFIIKINNQKIRDGCITYHKVRKLIELLERSNN